MQSLLECSLTGKWSQAAVVWPVGSVGCCQLRLAPCSPCAFVLGRSDLKRRFMAPWLCYLRAVKLAKFPSVQVDLATRPDLQCWSKGCASPCLQQEDAYMDTARAIA